MPSTGAGFVNMSDWLGLNQQAGQQMQQNAIGAANAAANPTYGGRFTQGKKAQQGTGWTPESQQALVHGSMWDAGLLGQQNQGQAGGHMQTAGGGLGSDFTGQPGAAGGPKMTKTNPYANNWSTGYGNVSSTTTAGSNGNSGGLIAGGGVTGQQQSGGTGTSQANDPLANFYRWITGGG